MNNNTGSFVMSQISHIRAGGLPVIFRKSRGLSKLLLAVFIVISIRLLRPFVLIRFGAVASHQIGGFAPMPEIYLSERDAGLRGPKAVDIFCYDPRGICNLQLDRMWKRSVNVFRDAEVAQRVLGWLPDKHMIPWAAEESVDFNGILKDTQPHISFTEDEEQVGQAGLRALGIPEGSPFVCFHARDTAHIASVKPEHDRPGSTYRNCSIGRFMPAAEELVRRGYFAVRMGSVVEEPLPFTSEKIIDYASHGRDDFLDIYLSAKCHFFLGCTSGLYAVPMIFRRPRVMTNYIPYEYAADWGPDCLVLPKRLWLREEARTLTFREALDTGVWLFRDSAQYETFGIDLIENTSEQITAAAIEMEERLKGTWQTESTSDDEALQQQFLTLFKSVELNRSLSSRIGADFLRENRDLLD